MDPEIAKYYSAQPESTQKILGIIRDAIKKAEPLAQEKISYGIPTFTLMGKNLVHYSGNKNHIGFYPGPEAIDKFSDDLEHYKTSKGSVQLPLDKEIPLDLIQEITKFRASQI